MLPFLSISVGGVCSLCSLQLLDGYHAPLIRQPHVRGSPPFQFTWTEIAELLGVSRMTIYRRRREFNISERRSTLTDLQLNELIRSWKSEMSNVGETLVMGRLHASGPRKS